MQVTSVLDNDHISLSHDCSTHPGEMHCSRNCIHFWHEVSVLFKLLLIIFHCQCKQWRFLFSVCEKWKTILSVCCFFFPPSSSQRECFSLWYEVFYVNLFTRVKRNISIVVVPVYYLLFVFIYMSHSDVCHMSLCLEHSCLYMCGAVVCVSVVTGCEAVTFSFCSLGSNLLQLLYCVLLQLRQGVCVCVCAHTCILAG